LTVLFKILLNGALVIISIFALIIILIVLPPKIKIWMSKEGYQIGLFEIEKKWISQGNYRSQGNSGLNGRINNDPKIIVFGYQKELGINLNFDNYQIGSKVQVWYHSDLKTAFLKAQHSDDFELPPLFMKQVYSAFAVCFLTILILSLKFFWRINRKRVLK